MAYKCPHSTMKNVIVLFLLGFFSCCSIFAQKIKKKEIDKFTKAEVIETSLETMYSVNLLGTGWCNKFEFQIRRTDGMYTMPANILMNKVVKYTENDGVTFLLDNDDTVDLKTNFTGIGSEAYAKGYWFRTSFLLTESDVEKLKKNKVTAIRINYIDGHYDKDIKENKQDLIQRSLMLFENIK